MAFWDIWWKRTFVWYDHLEFITCNIIIVDGVEGVDLMGGLDLACCKHVVWRLWRVLTE